MSRLRAHRARREGPRRAGAGAAMVEMLVVTMLLVLIVFGIIEFGNGFSNKLQVETATRAGARVGSSLGNDRLADYNLLQSVRSALAKLGYSNVDYVVVYKSTDTGRDPVGVQRCRADLEHGLVQRVHGDAAPEPDAGELHGHHLVHRLVARSLLVSGGSPDRPVAGDRLPRRVDQGALHHPHVVLRVSAPDGVEGGHAPGTEVARA